MKLNAEKRAFKLIYQLKTVTTNKERACLLVVKVSARR